ncbi:hypothetical protein [Actinacidiphila sp. ITFR-21]|uniref:hypothetical protein n=1 Tax=Actinacidiphila sp. ITFR-21 TaxID=3075199 RepID=UPI00288A2D8F|nr:hypothetical protein [Streptomyces sp. ITFR-21]WNI19134.1 hypothetical protein RLT57_28760 [Streptomyces sp. ITFR-21]
MNTHLPDGWQSFAWPVGWQPSDPKSLRLVRTGVRPLPERFCLAVRTPDMTTPGGGVVFTYRVRDRAVVLDHIGGIGQDITGHLAQVLAANSPEEWQQIAMEEVAAFCPADNTGGTVKPVNKRYKLTADHVRRVAEVYSEALAEGQPPTRAVQQRFDTAHSTAAKWVGHARKAGLLPKTDKGAAA